MSNIADEWLVEARAKSSAHDPDDRGDYCVVRLRTSHWHNKQGVFRTRSLTYQKRLSHGWNALEDMCETEGHGGDDILDRVVNLDECEDGLYSVGQANITTDWETGYADDWDLILYPYSRSQKEKAAT